MLSPPVVIGGLREALGSGDREVVAFVGAGGKTTAMFGLAHELHAAGARIVVTTTTRILVPPPSAVLEVITEDHHPDPLSAAAATLAAGRLPVVGRAVTAEGKLVGIPPERVADLAALSGVTHVLVEADGAAGRPFKAPRADEPVIPASTTLVVAVVGIDALGEPLTAEVAHRPEQVTALTGTRAGDPLSTTAIARVLLGPDGNTRGAPPGARIVAMVNKADTPQRVAAAHDLAAELRRCGAERVVIAALEADRPIVEVWSRR
jgi:probable selenium-dependent hydroxylase accessory protein YqeC